MILKTIGLLFKKSIDKDYIMIFDMGGNGGWEFHTFMMKFPIDMIGVIESSNGECCVFETFSGVQNSRNIMIHGRYVIEAKAGFIKEHKIKMGEKISWKSISL